MTIWEILVHKLLIQILAINGYFPFYLFSFKQIFRTFPDLFYKIRISFDFDKNSTTQSSPVILEILMLDTIVLCGNTVDMEGQSLFSWLFAKKKDPDGPDPEYVELAKKQWKWIEHQLRNSE